MHSFKRVHFTNIGLESCTIRTFCNLQLRTVPTQRKVISKCRTGVCVPLGTQQNVFCSKTLPKLFYRGFVLWRQEMFQVLLLWINLFRTVFLLDLLCLQSSQLTTTTVSRITLTQHRTTFLRVKNT